MPMTYRIDHDMKVVRMKGSGTLTDEELVSCISRLRQDPELPFGLPTISDLRQVDILEVTYEGFQKVAEIMVDTDQRRGPVRVAMVVLKESDVAMAKLYSIVSENAATGTSFEIFDSPAAAEAWLGLT